MAKTRAATTESVLERTVHWMGGVNSATCQDVLEKVSGLMKEDPRAEIRLVVTSPGGGTGLGLSFYDTITGVYKPNLHTVGSGDVDSAGVLVFLSGKKRSVTRNTTFLLHLAGRTFDASRRYTAKDMESMLREDTLKDFQYASVVAERSAGRLTTEKVLDMMAKNTVLSAEEALYHGLAHEVI